MADNRVFVTEEERKAIYADYRAGLTTVQLAEKYHRSNSVIWWQVRKSKIADGTADAEKPKETYITQAQLADFCRGLYIGKVVTATKTVYNDSGKPVSRRCKTKITALYPCFARTPLGDFKYITLYMMEHKK